MRHEPDLRKKKRGRAIRLSAFTNLWFRCSPDITSFISRLYSGVTYHSDSALVSRDGHTYIAVALSNSEQGGKWMGEIIVALDDIINNKKKSRRS